MKWRFLFLFFIGLILSSCNKLGSNLTTGRYICRQENYVLSLSVPDAVSHSTHNPRWNSWCLTIFKEASYTFQCLDGEATPDAPNCYTANFANGYGKRIVLEITFSDDYKTAEGIIQEQDLNIPFDKVRFVDDDTVLDINGDGILDEVQDL